MVKKIIKQFKGDKTLLEKTTNSDSDDDCDIDEKINKQINDLILNENVNNKILIERERELKQKQLKSVPLSKRLRPSDIHRIVRHTDRSIFDESNCCIWTGYITNLKNKRKGTYINFYFREKKKVALHRLLFANFKEDISDEDYIKYNCDNKGKCCNINHMIKFEYNSIDKPDDEISIYSNDDKKKKIKKEKKKETKPISFKITIN